MKLLIFLLILSGLTLAQKYEVVSCPKPLLSGETEGQSVECGMLSVPESHAKRFGRRLNIAVLILKASGPSSYPDPIIFLQGGPGGAALETVATWQHMPWRQTRDIILIDQRGTGYSEPDLRCPELYQSFNVLEGVEACRNRLIKSVNLQTFNSYENAADIDLLRKTLGYKQVNLFGVSYGTRLALTIMRDFPKGIRSVILDSTYPPQVNRMAETDLNFYTLLQKVFSDCQSDEVCHAAYPTLERDFMTSIDKLNTNPAEIWANTLYLSGDDILRLYFFSMYDEGITPSLPYSIHKLTNGDYQSNLLLLSGLVKPEELENNVSLIGRFIQVIIEQLRNLWREVQAEGVYYSTECQEDVLFHKQKQINQSIAQLPKMMQQNAREYAQTMFDICRIWRVTKSPEIEDRPVSSDIPTLILAGAYDPVTVPAWGELASKTLSNSYFYTFPNAAHGVFASGDCAISMIETFINNPMQAPDSTCIESLEMKFYVPR